MRKELGAQMMYNLLLILSSMTNDLWFHFLLPTYSPTSYKQNKCLP